MKASREIQNVSLAAIDSFRCLPTACSAADFAVVMLRLLSKVNQNLI
jgi:hypothetical protein